MFIGPARQGGKIKCVCGSFNPQLLVKSEIKYWKISHKTPVRELWFYRIVFSEEDIDFSGNFHPTCV